MIRGLLSPLLVVFLGLAAERVAIIDTKRNIAAYTRPSAPVKAGELSGEQADR